MHTEEGPDVPGGAGEGVNVVGFLRAELGLGEAARGLVAALRAADRPVALTDVALTASRRDDPTHDAFDDDNPYPVNVVCINADQVPLFFRDAGPGFMADRYNVGRWAWELGEFPAEWRDRFAAFDEVWVSSAHEAEAIAMASPVPVVTIPYVVAPPDAREAVAPRVRETPDEFVFLFTFDYFSVFERKNPLAVVEAFRRAFGPDEPVRLVLKSINHDHDPDAASRLHAAAEGLRVTFLEAYLSRDERAALTLDCDAYVSLHRAEGFGLTMAEAMAAGKPVIATGWSGNLAFMTIDNSYLVGYELVTLEADFGPYRRGQRWAEPRVEDAARWMRHVVDHPGEARARAARGASDVARELSAVAVGRRVDARLRAIRAFGRTGDPATAAAAARLAPPPPAPPPRPTLLQSVSFVASGLLAPGEGAFSAEWAAQSGYGAPGVALKRLLRAIALGCARLVRREASPPA